MCEEVDGRDEPGNGEGGGASMVASSLAAQ